MVGEADKLPPHLDAWRSILGDRWPPEAGPLPNQSSARTALDLGAKPGSKVGLAFVMYCRPTGATTEQVSVVCVGPQQNAAREKAKARSLDFAVSRESGSIAIYFMGPVGSQPGGPSAKLIGAEASDSLVDRKALEAMRAEFLRRASDFENFGKNGGTYFETERKYKDEIIASVRAIIDSPNNDIETGRSIYDALTTTEGPPLRWQTRQSVDKNHPELADDFYAVLGALARDQNVAVDAICQASSRLVKLRERGATALTPGEIRCLSFSVMAAANPQRSCFVKVEKADSFSSKLTGAKNFVGDETDTEPIERWLKLVDEVFRIMKDAWNWQPRDLFDVQGFAWMILDPQFAVEDGSQPPIDRDAVEAAIDEFEALGSESFFAKYSLFRVASNHWVRSSQSHHRTYLCEPIAAVAQGLRKIEGGWTSPEAAAAVLHNLGYVIVDEGNTPVQIPDKAFLLSGADRIRACALNYYIAPARKERRAEVTITSGRLHEEIGLTNNWANVCQTLEGPKFQQFAGVGAPRKNGKDRSSATTYTFSLTVNSKIEQYHMTQATNLILYGPPGTGKTFSTAAEAVRICDNRTEQDPIFQDRSALMQRYQALLAQERIEFVTFHQSYSYEEFVEGLRPETGASYEATEQGNASSELSSAGFRLDCRPGVFKVISERARRDIGDDSDNRRLDRTRSIFKLALGLMRYDEDLIRAALDSDYVHLDWGGDIDWSAQRFDSFEEIKREWNEKKDPSASGKASDVELTYAFRSALKDRDYVVVPHGQDRFRAFGRVVGEYYFDQDAETRRHRRKVEWIWRNDEGVDRDRFYKNIFRRQPIYRLKESVIDWDALEEIIFGRDPVRPDPHARPFVLVIDEINRANISKVFGELITLLEPDKRLGETNELRVRLPYSGELFGVPANLHIVGTMNTADRSIALLDTALRRRFSFRELMPRADTLETVDGIDLGRLLRTLNARIEYLFDREHQIGHAYFMGCRSRQDIETVMRNKVIPLLAEYFYEDWEKVAAVLGDIDAASDGSQRGFLDRIPLQPPNGMNEDADSSTRYRWLVKDRFDFERLTSE